MLKKNQLALIKKDLYIIMRDPMIILPILIVPLIFVLLLPIGLFIGAQYGYTGMNGMDLMLKNLPHLAQFSSVPQQLVYLGVNYMIPSLFLLIPVMAASIIGASSFVGEKEHKTLETLLYSPLSVRDIFIAKLAGTFIPAYLITLVCFVIFGIVANIGGWFYFERLIFPTPAWLVLIFWLSPAATLLALVFVVMISSRVETFQQAQQMVAMVVLPIIFIVIGQSTGLFIFGPLVMAITGAVLYILTFILIRAATRRFTPEKMLQ